MSPLKATQEIDYNPQEITKSPQTEYPGFFLSYSCKIMINSTVTGENGSLLEQQSDLWAFSTVKQGSPQPQKSSSTEAEVHNISGV